MFKIVSFLAVVGVVRAGILPAASPLAVAQPVLAQQFDEYDPHPQYNFAYEVQDALTGDSKNHVEARDGDVVQGQYSLIDADGYKRIVDYSADAANGFNALVRREPLGLKTAAIAPAIVKSAPLALSASPLASYPAPAPALIQSSPILSHGLAPALIRSAPLAIASAPSLATAGYAGYNSYNGYAAPGIIRSASPALIKSAPIVSYASSPAAYDNAHAAQLASSTVVKTAYSSPFASYHY